MTQKKQVRTFKKPVMFVVLVVAYALSIVLAKQKEKPESTSVAIQEERLPASTGSK